MVEAEEWDRWDAMVSVVCDYYSFGILGPTTDGH